MATDRDNPWSGPRLPRGPRPTRPLADCWRCGNGIPGRPVAYRVTAGDHLVGFVRLCRTCIAAVPRLDPDPLNALV